MKADFNSNIPFMDGIKGTSARTGLTEHHVRKLALSGAVKAIRAGGRSKILINQQSIFDYLNSSCLNDAEPAENSGIQPISIKL